MYTTLSTWQEKKAWTCDRKEGGSTEVNTTWGHHIDYQRQNEHNWRRDAERWTCKLCSTAIEGILQWSTLHSLSMSPYQMASKHFIHSCENHWIAVSTVNASDGTVRVYDPVYDTLDEDTRSIISAMFHLTQSHLIKLQLVPTQKQGGGRDCGLFSIANVTATS